MSYLNYVAESVENVLSHTFFVHIYSYPNFLMENLINIIMIFINCLLIVEINDIIEELHLPPLRNLIMKPFAGSAGIYIFP